MDQTGDALRILVHLLVPGFFLYLAFTRQSAVAIILSIIATLGVATSLMDYFGDWMGGLIAVAIIGVVMLAVLEARDKGLTP